MRQFSYVLERVVGVIFSADMPRRDMAKINQCVEKTC